MSTALVPQGSGGQMPPPAVQAAACSALGGLDMAAKWQGKTMDLASVLDATGCLLGNKKARTAAAGQAFAKSKARKSGKEDAEAADDSELEDGDPDDEPAETTSATHLPERLQKPARKSTAAAKGAASKAGAETMEHPKDESVLGFKGAKKRTLGTSSSQKRDFVGFWQVE